MRLILFIEGQRSERQLLRLVADRLRLRRYLGYDLTQAFLDHRSRNRLRERYGLVVFRRFFESVVERCIAAGLVKGEAFSIDATKVVANAGPDSLRPRFAVEAHWRDCLPASTRPTRVSTAETVAIGIEPAEQARPRACRLP